MVLEDQVILGLAPGPLISGPVLSSLWESLEPWNHVSGGLFRYPLSREVMWWVLATQEGWSVGKGTSQVLGHWDVAQWLG